MADAIPEIRIVPPQVTYDLLGVGIQQELVMIEAVPIGWVIRSVDTVAVKKSRPGLRQIAVPDLVGLFLDVEPARFSAPGSVKTT